MASEKVQNYTAEQTATVVAQYAEGVSVEAIAMAMGKTVRSIVAKLSREGVYKSKAESAPKAKAMTKLDMIKDIAALVDVDPSVFASFEKADKPAIFALAQAVSKLSEKAA